MTWKHTWHSNTGKPHGQNAGGESNSKQTNSDKTNTKTKTQRKCFYRLSNLYSEDSIPGNCTQCSIRAYTQFNCDNLRIILSNLHRTQFNCCQMYGWNRWQKQTFCCTRALRFTVERNIMKLGVFIPFYLAFFSLCSVHNTFFSSSRSVGCLSATVIQ